MILQFKSLFSILHSFWFWFGNFGNFAKIKYVVFGIILAVFIEQIFVTVLRLLVSRERASMMNIIVTIAVVLASFGTIIVSYTIIIRKLLQQNQLVQPASASSRIAANQQQIKSAIEKAKYTRHVTTVKVFVGVTVLFLASYTAVVLRILSD